MKYIMSEEFINQVTLNCLMNKDQYNKYVKNNTIKLPNSVNKKDKKFYKKRIYNIIKQLLSSQETEIEPRLFTDVQKSFDNFVKKLGLSEKTGDFITQMPTPGIMQQPQNTTMNILQNLKKVILTDIGLLYQITLTASEISNISAAFLRIVNSEKITFNTLQLFNTGLIFLNKVM